ncbi:MAG: hypothetical protein ACLR5N_04845 [Haemophilus parainfluenzae]
MSSFLSKNALSPLAFVSMVFGLFFFVRLCLSPVHYIASNQSIGQSALQVWRAGIKRNGVLIIYALTHLFTSSFSSEHHWCNPRFIIFKCYCWHPDCIISNVYFGIYLPFLQLIYEGII